KWLKKEGDVVNVGDPLVELETDKIDLEVAAPQGGVLSKIAHADGDDVKVGEILGVIEEGGAGREARGATATNEPEPKLEAGSGKLEAGSGKLEAGGGKLEAGGGKLAADKTRATPAARNAAQQNAVDLKTVQGSGDAGRVMRRDVESVAAKPVPVAKPGPARTPPPAPRPAGERTEDRVRMSKRRATIAKRLVEAQSTAAMLTTFNEIDMSAVQAVRERHKQAFKERHGVTLGLTSFFVKAAISALREFPRINAEIQGDEMVLKHYYDIGIAVGASEGLVVPVLRDADRLSFVHIEAKVREFAKAADDGTLSLADLKGGTFTITNGGVFGSLFSTPILNPPQVGILGLHAIKDRPMAVGGQVMIRPVMYAALTYDHRIVDGAEAVQFLVRVKQLVEDPGALLIE
ncbi:MAG TPA: 2-oxoglutarate dehydrogenase complex dihydrolipoyllysine-residue succinyltransferase, partial [Vicinamibacterales bacterium]|nr:2-oxoglutarate dehydrogenase complex dihydrolipoyllysine-residue succinyltransferase [Vicinamibacterales bacterium]